MTLRKNLALTLALGILCLSPTVFAQEPPQPGPEHDILKKLVGTWTTLMKGEGLPDSKGMSTCKLECGGLWLTSNFEGDFAGAPFQGKGLDSYDAKKKKYVSVWVDSMITSPMVFEGDYDKSKKTLTMVSESPGPDGELAMWKSVTTWKDDDHHQFQMYLTPKGGSESLMMTIEYTRQKEKKASQ